MQVARACPVHSLGRSAFVKNAQLQTPPKKRGPYWDLFLVARPERFERPTPAAERFERPVLMTFDGASLTSDPGR